MLMLPSWPLQHNEMSTFRKQEPIDPLVFLRGIPMNTKMKKEGEQNDKVARLSEGTYVSHVPPSTVSASTHSRSSNSTLCSSSSKEVPIVEEVATSNTASCISLNETKTKVSKVNKRPYKKSLIAAADEDARNLASIHHDAEAGSLVALQTSSSASEKPSKRPRMISTECTTAVDVSTMAPSSSEVKVPYLIEANATSKAVSPRIQDHLQKKQPLLLLGEAEDETHLSPLHVFVRKQIEVFTATPTELAQPAPGRKQPIQLHQVGLRCIHCRHISVATSQKTRVKRAVCYPSSVARIYHSVSDMKFDHFSNCKELPADLRQAFETLKTEEKKTKKERKSKNANGTKGQSSASTAQYYRETATRMGLVDGQGGIIYMPKHQSGAPSYISNSIATTTGAADRLPQHPLQVNQRVGDTSLGVRKRLHQDNLGNLLTNLQNLSAANNAAVASMLLPQIQISTLLATSKNDRSKTTAVDLKNLASVMNSGMLQSLVMNAIAIGANAQKSLDAAVVKAIAGQHQTQLPDLGSSPSPPQPQTQAQPTSSKPPSIDSLTRINPDPTTSIPLACPEDENFLNSLHCFVRKHVELFAADQEDITAPCPGRKTRVVLGQVGIRCLHCAKARQRRVKRAICYPPSIDSIYHSVSNMKFDHFGICPRLPPEARAELAALKTSGRKAPPGGPGSMNTADYYRESALKKGLVDTKLGIRFQSDGSDAQADLKIAASPSESSAEESTGLSALVMAAASHVTSI